MFRTVLLRGGTAAISGRKSGHCRGHRTVNEKSQPFRGKKKPVYLVLPCGMVARLSFAEGVGVCMLVSHIHAAWSRRSNETDDGVYFFSRNGKGDTAWHWIELTSRLLVLSLSQFNAIYSGKSRKRGKQPATQHLPSVDDRLVRI